MKLTYSDLDHGWIALHVEAGNVRYTLQVSSLLNDCILELLNATTQFQRSSHEEFVVFWEEPSSFVWRLKKENNWVLIQRYFLKDYQPVNTFVAKYLKDAELVDTFVTDVKTLTNQVIRFVSVFQDSPGIKRYEEAWHHEFPVNALKCLKGLRRTAERHPAKEFSCEVPADSQFAKAMQILHPLVASEKINPEPGLSQDIIDVVCLEANIAIPPPIAEWLLYCNGISTMAHGSLYGLDEVTDYSEYTSHWKDRGWTPIGGDGCGSYYLVVKHETSGRGLYPVVFADHEDSVMGIEENDEHQICNRISYIVASDLPHFLEAIFLYQEHNIRCENRDDNEYLNFWWPFDKEHVLQFDPDINQFEFIKPWDED